MTKTVSQEVLVPHAKRVRVGGIVLDSNNNLLIVYGRESQKWSLPKGALDNGDETYFEGALREIYEESGLKLRPPSNIKSPQRWSINKALIYLLKVPGHCPKTKPKDTNEVLKTNWLDLNNRHRVEEIKRESNKMLIAAIDRILNHLPPKSKQISPKPKDTSTKSKHIAPKPKHISPKPNHISPKPNHISPKPTLKITVKNKNSPAKVKKSDNIKYTIHHHQQTEIPCI